MIHCGKNLVKSLNNKSVQEFAGLLNKRKPTRKDLEKYDVVWVGANLGGICSRHFDEVVHGKFTNMVVFDQQINQAYPIRCIYEQQVASKTDYLPNAKLAINMYTAHSDGIGLQKILPEENAVVLRNGRKIQYNHLVLAMGMQEDLEAIKGFEDAWRHPEHPVFTCKDHYTWRSFLHKYPRWHYNFFSGDAYYCIPPYPFRGEVEAYNFFISTEIWKWYKANGKLHPNATLTVMNANEKFVQYSDSADAYIKEELEKRGVRVEYGQNLVEINQDRQIATYQNVKTGEKTTRPYHNLYSIIPTKPHQALLEAGLASKETLGLLDLDINTLRHKKYKNIFGLGDCANLPTTKTFWGGFFQVHVVRNNVQRSLQGQSLNALYDGFSYQPLYTGQKTLTWVAHYYDQRSAWYHLQAKSGLLATIRYKLYARQKKKFLDYYLKKTWGPPYHKFKQTFKELPGSPEASGSGGSFDKLFAKKKEAEAH